MNASAIRRLAGCAFAALCVTAQTAPPEERFESIRPLILRALDSPEGRASGILDGPLAQRLRTEFRTAADLQVEVSTLHTFKQPGCKRLSIQMRLPGVIVRMPSGASREFQTDTALNMCRDGNPPSETLGSRTPR